MKPYFKEVDPKKLPQMRSLRLSSKEEEQMNVQKIKSILDNNKFFPHLYDPYYDRKDIKKNLYTVIKMDNLKKNEENNKLTSNQKVIIKQIG